MSGSFKEQNTAFVLTILQKNTLCLLLEYADYIFSSNLLLTVNKFEILNYVSHLGLQIIAKNHLRPLELNKILNIFELLRMTFFSRPKDICQFS